MCVSLTDRFDTLLCSSFEYIQLSQASKQATKMSHFSEVSSISTYCGMMDDIMIGTDGEDSASMIANRGNNEALQHLQRGDTTKAWTSLEGAAKAAMKLLAPKNKAVGVLDKVPAAAAAAAKGEVHISIVLIPGSSNISSSAFVLRHLFVMEAADKMIDGSNSEVLVAIVLYNLAFLLHLRGTDNDHHTTSTAWNRKKELERAVQLYQHVIKVASQCVQLEHPVLIMSALNNCGQIHHLQQDFDAMRDCWSKLATILSDLPPTFSLLNVRSMQLNIQLKDRLDPSTQPAKKKRSS